MAESTSTDALVEADSEELAPVRPSQIRVLMASPLGNLVLFLLTLVSTFYVGNEMVEGHSIFRGWVFAVPLMAILLTHEFGHYLQARRHGVDASLPYFLPFPISMIGTFGAVIAMRGRIKSRNALFDIGASGPLAGLVVAIPVLVIGLRLSYIAPIGEHGLDEGQSLGYLLIKRLTLGPIPHGSDVFLHPTAFAGWAGLFMTMLNLVPVAQLDGGHVAYSLFGARQDRYSRYAHSALLAVVVLDAIYSTSMALRAHLPIKEAIYAAGAGVNWLVWYGLLWAVMRFGGKEHPPTDDDVLSPVRRALAWMTLGIFVLLFMPIWFSSH